MAERDSMADISRNVASETLAQNNVKQETINEFVKLIEECEFAQFAPSGETGKMEQIYKNAAEIINKFESELR